MPLIQEMKELGVDVITLAPGVVRTEMNEGLRSNSMGFSKAGSLAMDADQCVAEALQALYDGKANITPGFMNTFSRAVGSFVPQETRFSMGDGVIAMAMSKEYRAFPKGA